MKFLQGIPVFVFILIAAILEAMGDAVIRRSIYEYTGSMRAGMMLLGALLVFGYGFVLNLAPVEFGELVGLYIATLFVVWQVVNYFTYHTLPTLPIIVGGSLVIIGGLVITYWKP